VSVHSPHRFDSNGRLMGFNAGEAHAVYLAYAETHHGHGIAKVGVTVEPYRRIYEVYQGCPFPLLTFVWAWAGIRADAFYFEAAVKRGMAEQGRQLRGEWFKFGHDLPEDGDKLQAVRERLKREIGGFSLDWKDGDIDDVLAFSAVKRIKPKKAKPKRKPWP